MTTPLTPPTFGDKYNVGLTDIGSGYAAGITSAGQSIAGAIGAVMGGINQKTGEVEPGLLDQKKSSEDMLDMLHLHGMLSDDEYAKAKTSGLSAQQKLIGVTAADFNINSSLILSSRTRKRLLWRKSRHKTKAQCRELSIASSRRRNAARRNWKRKTKDCKCSCKPKWQRTRTSVTRRHRYRLLRHQTSLHHLNYSLVTNDR